MAEQIAILRKCQRCHIHKSIDEFASLGRLCRRCIPARHTPTNYVVRIRALVITDKGRAMVREMNAVA